MSKGRRIWIDGKFVPWEHATVHVLSHSLQRGSLVFDYMSVHDTPRGVAVFRLGDHIERFATSCGLVELPLALGARALERAVCDTVIANPGCRSVKICAYLPSIEVDVVPQDDTMSVAIAAYDAAEDVIKRNRGTYHWRPDVKLWIEKQQRNRRPDIVSPHAKVSANYASPMAAKWRARKAGYDEIVLVDDEGFVAEGPTTNIFAVDEQGSLRTPVQKRVLLGVTRRSIIDIAKHDGFAVREESIHPDELLRSREVFLTGTTAGVWPVTSIDGDVVGDGVAGPVTRALADHFRRIVAGEDADFQHWLALVEEA